MAKDPKTGKQISEVAHERLERLREPKGERGRASAADLKQIRNRQEAERLPEGNVRITRESR